MLPTRRVFVGWSSPRQSIPLASPIRVQMPMARVTGGRVEKVEEPEQQALLHNVGIEEEIRTMRRFFALPRGSFINSRTRTQAISNHGRTAFLSAFNSRPIHLVLLLSHQSSLSSRNQLSPVYPLCRVPFNLCFFRYRNPPLPALAHWQEGTISLDPCTHCLSCLLVDVLLLLSSTERQ